MLAVEVFATEELGDRTYVVHDGHVAVVIDPQRDLERYLDFMTARGLNCHFVLETHVHNDYVSGGRALSELTGASYVLARHDEVDFLRRSVVDGDELVAGGLTIRVVATPGHTEGHVAYVVHDDRGESVVFTGGSLLFGSVGRTDLVDAARVDEFSRHQYQSVRHLAASLPDATPVYPTHGFGSFCSSGAATGGDASTIGLERTRNDALVIGAEDDFVRRLIAGLTAYPSYYAHMAPLNRAGAADVELVLPRALDADELAHRLRAGEWVVDLRARHLYAAQHLRGTVGIELGQHFSTYLGWLVEWGAPLTLVGETKDDVLAALRQLRRIGIDHFDGVAVGPLSSLAPTVARDHFLRSTFAALALEADPTILDVRRDDEFARAALPGALHIPLHQLLLRLDEVPTTTLWVHCASGYRASIAASLLARAGRDVILIDDDFANATSLLERGSTQMRQLVAPRLVRSRDRQLRRVRISGGGNDTRNEASSDRHHWWWRRRY